MDDLYVNKNFVSTECGHCFHASCLMTNVARNGFGCPYCRTTMAEEVEEDEETIEDDMSNDLGEELFDDYSLRGLRFFMNNVNGEEHDREDVLEEEEDEEIVVEENVVPLPSAAFVTQKLVERGVTMEDLVKALLTSHEEFEDNEEYDQHEGEIWGKFRIIISNYEAPSEVEVLVPEPAPEPAVEEPQIVERIVNIFRKYDEWFVLDTTSQSKNVYKNIVEEM
jgi:thiol-disulfide isomerase/thioredoxin